MITLGERAIYKGKEYEFMDREEKGYAIFSDDSRDMELGFRKINENRYLKEIDLNELEFVFQKDTTVVYKGDSFLGSVIKGSKIMLFTGDVELGKKYGMKEYNRFEYFLYVELSEVDEIVQKWTPLKLSKQ